MDLSDRNDSVGTYEDFRDSFFTYDSPQTIVLICIYVPVFLVALAGNVLVLLVVLMNRKMRSVTNYFLVNLAVADLLVTLICIPITVTQKIYQLWIYGEFLCKITEYMQGVSVCASVLTIVCMSVDRFLAICHPMKSRQYCTVPIVRKVIVLTWFLSALVMIPIIVVKRLDVYDNIAGKSLSFCREVWGRGGSDRQLYDLFLLCFIYVLPGSLVVTLYSKIGLALWSTNSALHRQDSLVGNSNKVIQGRRRVARMMIVISVLFAVCWLPYYIMTIYMDFTPDKTSQVTPEVYSFALLLGHSNNAQNPVLYCFMHKGFKAAVKRLLRCKTYSPQSSPSDRCTQRSTTFRMQTDRSRESVNTNGDNHRTMQSAPSVV